MEVGDDDDSYDDDDDGDDDSYDDVYVKCFNEQYHRYAVMTLLL